MVAGVNGHSPWALQVYPQAYALRAENGSGEHNGRGLTQPVRGLEVVLPGDPATTLTEADREFVRAVTGYAVGPSGLAESGAPALPSGAAALAQAIAADRRSGTLSGTITGPYLRELFKRSEASGTTLEPAHLEGGLRVLAAASPFVGSMIDTKL